jgi:hypothetical protein
MRFAWQRKNSPDYASVKQGCAVQLLRLAYNVIWWVPIVLTLVKVMDYRTGFILVIVLTLVRLAANVYVNNTLTAEQAEGFPFRA